MGLAHLNIAVIWYLYVRALVVGGPSNHEPQTVFRIVMKHQKVKKQGGKLDTYLKKIEERKKKDWRGHDGMRFGESGRGDVEV